MVCYQLVHAKFLYICGPLFTITEKKILWSSWMQGSGHIYEDMSSGSGWVWPSQSRCPPLAIAMDYFMPVNFNPRDHEVLFTWTIYNIHFLIFHHFELWDLWMNNFKEGFQSKNFGWASKLYFNCHSSILSQKHLQNLSWNFEFLGFHSLKCENSFSSIEKSILIYFWCIFCI